MFGGRAVCFCAIERIDTSGTYNQVFRRVRHLDCMRGNKKNQYTRKPNYPAFQITIIYAPTTRMHTTRPFPPQPYKWSPNGGFQSVRPGLRRRAGSRAHTNYRKRKVRHRPTHGYKKIAPTRAHENSPRTSSPKTSSHPKSVLRSKKCPETHNSWHSTDTRSH
jgi:hypothetical protein